MNDSNWVTLMGVSAPSLALEAAGITLYPQMLGFYLCIHPNW
ncbi:hypothetical protein TOL_3299 [Thalassolituus oleivorans MIL-1]|uniref:Uncharacterized protein n=1 Tax=Thalassolituus oleivorans MIL-1 TaxID=1298593 RepID=M5DVU8_9GAMM|nr:hypothetical protein TOL_3299 [Thalassolituus oleivorans MIL-1]